MAGQNILKEAGQSLSGAISKAVIEIHDERPKNVKVLTTNVKSKMADLQTGVALDTLGDIVNDIKNDVEANIADLQNRVPSTSENVKRFEVKFNPNQISFQVYAGKEVVEQNLTQSQSNNNQQVAAKYLTIAPRIQMNVQLVFEDYERTEAFMMEKIGDTSALLRTGVVAAVNAKSKKTYSVRTQVEGFIAAMRDNYTRKITFNWGKMSYTGILLNVSAQYTMFSMDGNPIRANVNLGILCADSSIEDNDMGAWQNSFKKVFENDQTTNLGSKLQSAGNLLNIHL